MNSFARAGRAPSVALMLLAGASLLVLRTTIAAAVCCPFPCETCNLQSIGQVNFIAFDRSKGRVKMIPNLRFQGPSSDFALVVPTPGLPTLIATEAGLWDEAQFLTAPTFGRRSTDGPLSCGKSVTTPAPVPLSDDGIIIHGQVQVGGMLATILSSSNADTLVAWLNGHHYRVRPDDAAKFEPYIDRDWYFTAMRPDSADHSHPMPPGGWDTNVSPILFSWSGDAFELPLEILDVNRGGRLPVIFYVLDEHRMTLSGFTTEYANHVDAQEFSAIEDRFPHLAKQLRSGLWLTRLTRTFAATSPMQGTIPIVRAEKDEEYRRTGGGSFFADAWLLALAAAGVLWRGRRRHSARSSFSP